MSSLIIAILAFAIGAFAGIGASVNACKDKDIELDYKEVIDYIMEKDWM